MTCTHLNQLYQLCKDANVKLSSTDLIHIVCKQCEKEEVCPSVLFEEYEEHEMQDANRDSTQSSAITPKTAQPEK